MARWRIAASTVAITGSTVLMIATMPISTAGLAQGENPKHEKSAASMAELWVDPDGNARDLDAGVGGTHRRPMSDARYNVLTRDTSGFSITYKVKDEHGDQWTVKIGPEAQPEVVSSRIVWALGYHQLPSYFVERWVAVEDGKEGLRGGARFRPHDFHAESKGTWSWEKNPFAGTRQMNGLLVLMMLLNSTDLKDDNNELFEVRDDHAEQSHRWYVVKDLGASLGETGAVNPRRGFIDAFEREPFISGTHGSFVSLHFNGRHKNLLEHITPEDVKWTCSRVMKLTDSQLRDAFHAGGYDDDRTARFIDRIRKKATEGLALP